MRIASLDGVRGVAILLVLLVHLQIDGTQGGLDRFAHVLFGGGWLGVDLFFVLSGFLIAGGLIDARHRGGYFRVFYWRRLLRIWPLYYLLVAFLFLAVPHLPGLFSDARMEGRLPWYVLYASNIDDALQGVPGTSFRHVWSLAVEEQFYLLWPVVILLCPPRALRWVCVSLLPAALLLRVGLVAIGVTDTAIYQLMPTRIDGFAVGTLLAVLWRAPHALTTHRPALWALLGLSVAGLASIGVRTGTLATSSVLMDTVGYSFAALGFGALVALALVSRPVAALFSGRVLGSFGRYSYAIYLVHLPLWEVIRPHVPVVALGHTTLVIQLAVYVGMAALLWSIGWLSWHGLEERLLRLRGWVTYGAPAEPAPRPVAQVGLVTSPSHR